MPVAFTQCQLAANPWILPAGRAAPSCLFAIAFLSCLHVFRSCDHNEHCEKIINCVPLYCIVYGLCWLRCFLLVVFCGQDMSVWTSRHVVIISKRTNVQFSGSDSCYLFKRSVMEVIPYNWLICRLSTASVFCVYVRLMRWTKTFLGLQVVRALLSIASCLALPVNVHGLRMKVLIIILKALVINYLLSLPQLGSNKLPEKNYFICLCRL